MADIVSPEKRSQMMAGIKGKNTRPERMIRSSLHGIGFRYRVHRNDLPGKPDLVFPKYKAILFVHGCFFHGHGCHIFKWPKGEKADFWKNKITRNQEVDRIVMEKLLAAGWRVGVVWECAVKGKYRLKFEDVIEACAKWLLSDENFFVIRGTL